MCIMSLNKMLMVSLFDRHGSKCVRIAIFFVFIFKIAIFRYTDVKDICEFITKTRIFSTINSLRKINTSCKFLCLDVLTNTEINQVINVIVAKNNR